MGKIGSWDWLAETGGNLTAKEKRALFSSIGRTFGQFAADRVRLAVGVRTRHSLGTDELWPSAPDSQLSRHAEEQARELQSSPVVQHGLRSWVFGSALAKIDGAVLDPELFHAAALLHDAGIEHTEPNRCFTYRSAQAASDVAARAGVDRSRAVEMMDGIGSHITPGLRYEDTAIGFYLQAGAMADLAGLRAWQLPNDLRARTEQAYPREGVHEVLSRCWHAEAQAVPNGRAHFADTWGGFSRIVRWLPVAK